MKFVPPHLVLTLLFIATLPIPLQAGRSNSLLDVAPDGSRFLVANADNGTVSVVDVKDRKVLHEIAVGDKPEGVTWIGKGPLAAVTVYREDLVVFIDADKGTVVKKLTVDDEPYGIVANDAGTRAWVTHEYPGLISEIDLKEQKIVRTIKAVPFIRGIALANDDKRVYVTEFYSSKMHAIELATGKVVDSWKGIENDNLCRHVTLHPKRNKAYLAHLRSRVEIIGGTGSIFPQMTIYDTIPPNDTKRKTAITLDNFNGLGVPTNPWESAMTPDGKRLFIVYAGTNDMNICQVLDDDFKELEAIGGLVRVGQNPRSVRISADGKLLFVNNTLDFEVTIYDIANDRFSRVGSVTVCKPAKTPEWVRGKQLFSVANFQMSAPRWISCASCHPDGASDGRVWHNPEGKRKTPPMFGLAHTHPIHWSADRDEVQDFEYTIRSRLMLGTGLVRGPIRGKFGFTPIELEEKMAERSKDLDALAIYTNSFEFTTLSPHIPAPGKLHPEAERGKKLFLSKEVGCATCHSGPYYTDSSLSSFDTKTKRFKAYDVGTGKDDPSEKMGPAYDTPTLLGIYRSAPYLHHGKAKTLHEVLTVCNKDDKHGKTSHLKPTEVDDLVAFLKSLPYEKPPMETPNTVKYRVVPKKE